MRFVRSLKLRGNFAVAACVLVFVTAFSTTAVG